MFHHYRQHLDATLLGYLEVDSAGNVNGSDRGERLTDLVGPGGMPSIISSADCVFFVGGWMANARWKVVANGLRLLQPGLPKFVRKVRTVTFSARAALEDGKKVFYVTNVGVFRLTQHGLLLTEVMPGIDIGRDILDVSEARILLPGNGEVPRASASVVTGRDFVLQWPHQTGGL